MATTWVKYEGIAFNAEWAASKSLGEFSRHEAHHGLSKEQYREVHDLCKQAVGKPTTKAKAEEAQAEEPQQGDAPEMYGACAD